MIDSTDSNQPPTGLSNERQFSYILHYKLPHPSSEHLLAPVNKLKMMHYCTMTKIHPAIDYM